MIRFGCLLVAVAFLGGCSPSKIYAWGRYEELVYSMYAEPWKASTATQVEKMEEDYQKARSVNKRVHPGFHAHLGYMYFQLGKLDQSRQQFLTEKAEFPESAVFMNRLLANMEKQ